MPKVTVAMPVYNDEKYLREAIDSILAQSFTDFELLIINDGSTDTSMDTVRSYADARIRILNFAENKGRPFVRNAALDNAQGDYLAWMDSDDISTPDRLEKQVAFMEAHPEVDVCGTAMQFFHEASHRHYPPLVHEDIQARIWYECSLHNATAIMRMKSITQHHLRYRDTMARVEDYAFWIDMLVNTSLRAANIGETLYHYRYFHRPTSRTYHVKAVFYLLEYLGLPATEENAQKHTVLSFANYADMADRAGISPKDILAWANTLYEALPQQKNISYAHALRELHIKVERFLANTPNPWQYVTYYKTLPAGKKHNLVRLLGMLLLRKVHAYIKK